MKIYYKRITSFITFTIVVVFLTQSLAWAKGPSCLATNGNQRWEDLKILRRPEVAGNTEDWLSFPVSMQEDMLREAKLTKVYMAVNEEIERIGGKDKAIVGAVGVGKDGYSFVFPKGLRFPKGVRPQIQKRLGFLLQKLQVFEPGTRVRIVSGHDQPLTYHSRDNVLDIHAVLLTQRVPMDLCLYFGTHDARHKVIRYLSPLAEEVLNVYMDFASINRLLKSSSSVDRGKATQLMLNLSRVVSPDYSKLLDRYSSFVGESVSADILLDHTLDYIWRNSEWVRDATKITSRVSPINELRRLLDTEMKSENSPLYLVRRYGSRMHPCFPDRPSRDVASFVAEVSSCLRFNDLTNLFDNLGREVELVKEICRYEGQAEDFVRQETGLNHTKYILKIAERAGEVYPVYMGEDESRYLSYQQIKEQGTYIRGRDPDTGCLIYIEKEKQHEIDALKYRLWEEIHERYPKNKEQTKRLIDLGERYCNKEDQSIQLGAALKMLEVSQCEMMDYRDGREYKGYPVSEYGVYAALIHRIPVDVLEQDPAIVDEQSKLIYQQYSKIAQVLKLQHQRTSHTPQNALHMVTKLCIGSTPQERAVSHEVAYLCFSQTSAKLDWGLRHGLTHPYEILKQEVERIVVPLTGIVGARGIAGALLDKFLEVSIGKVRYDMILRQMCDDYAINAPDAQAQQEALNDILQCIETEVNKEFEDLDVRVSVRRKGRYSYYYKSRARHDNFGVQIIFQERNISMYEREKIENLVFDRLNRLFVLKGLHEMQGRGYSAFNIRTELNADNSSFSQLMDKYHTPLGSVEVQVFFDRRNYMLYRFGYAAHWIYKLLVRLRRAGINNAEFDRKLYSQISPHMREGDVRYNLDRLAETLYYKNRWEYVGVVLPDKKFAIVPVKFDETALEVASDAGVRLLDKNYRGLRRVQSITGYSAGALDVKVIGDVIPNDKTGVLKTGIYEVETGALEVDYGEARKTAVHTRTALDLALRFHQKTMPKQFGQQGQVLVDQCLSQIKGKYKRIEVENEVLSFPALFRGKRGGLIFQGLELDSLDRFYTVLALANDPKEGALRERLLREIYSYMTGWDLPDEIDWQELRREWKISSDAPDVAPLVYLFTVGLRGRKVLEETFAEYGGVLPKDPISSLQSKLMYFSGIYDELISYRELCARIALEPVLLYCALLKVKGGQGVPFFEISVDQKPENNVEAEIKKIMFQYGISLVGHPLKPEDPSQMVLYYSQKEPGTDKVALQAFRDVKGVTAANIGYTEGEEISTRGLSFSVICSRRDMDEVEIRLQELWHLFSEEYYPLSVTRTRNRILVESNSFALSETISDQELYGLIKAYIEKNVTGTVVNFNVLEKQQIRLDIVMPKGKFAEQRSGIVQILKDQGFKVTFVRTYGKKENQHVFDLEAHKDDAETDFDLGYFRGVLNSLSPDNISIKKLPKKKEGLLWGIGGPAQSLMSILFILGTSLFLSGCNALSGNGYIIAVVIVAFIMLAILIKRKDIFHTWQNVVSWKLTRIPHVVPIDRRSFHDESL